MKTLPVAIFTHNRTRVACATVEALMANLFCNGRELRYILCDDRSEPGHVEAVLDVFRRRGVEPSVHLNNDGRIGLGASMNKGLEDAFSDSGVCLRIEDDWFLKRPLDVGKWADCMDGMSIGAIRMGMMFRSPKELIPFGMGLVKVESNAGKTYTFNNQVALVSSRVYDILGSYPEGVDAQTSESEMAFRYNRVTERGRFAPYVCWPEGWEIMVFHGERMAFDHIGASTLGHSRYKIPPKYALLNDSESDRRVRAAFAT